MKGGNDHSGLNFQSPTTVQFMLPVRINPITLHDQIDGVVTPNGLIVRQSATIPKKKKKKQGGVEGNFRRRTTRFIPTAGTPKLILVLWPHTIHPMAEI